MAVHRVPYTWSDFDRDVRVLAKEIAKDELEFDAIYAVPRGGLVLGVVLSHLLNKPLEVSFKTAMHSDKKYLVVDDISESGKTLELVKTVGTATATLHYVRGSDVEPDYWIREKFPDTWIEYPWEVPGEDTVATRSGALQSR